MLIATAGHRMDRNFPRPGVSPHNEDRAAGRQHGIAQEFVAVGPKSAAQGHPQAQHPGLPRRAGAGPARLQSQDADANSHSPSDRPSRYENQTPDHESLYTAFLSG